MKKTQVMEAQKSQQGSRGLSWLWVVGGLLLLSFNYCAWRMIRAASPEPAPPHKALWKYDAGKLLADKRLNPEFVDKAHLVLTEAAKADLRPRVWETYRSAEQSGAMHQAYKEGKGSAAAPAWKSCHNYGLAMDVFFVTADGFRVSTKMAGWRDYYERFAAIAKKHGFVWGGDFVSLDLGHFEYHPKWPGGADGVFLVNVREWALQATAPQTDLAKTPPPGKAPDWTTHFWWAAGAGGAAPSSHFLQTNPVPRLGIRIVLGYSAQDKHLRDEFMPQLDRLAKAWVIRGWDEKVIGPSKTPAGKLDERLKRDDLTVLFLTRNLLASGYCQSAEVKMILERETRGEARVLPVLVEDPNGAETPFGTGTYVPTNGMPITQSTNRNAAWNEVASAIEEAAEALQQSRPPQR